MTPLHRSIVAATAVLLLCAPETFAQDSQMPAPEERPDKTTGEGIPAAASGSGATLILFPESELYPHNIADPHRVGFAVQAMNFSSVGIDRSEAGINVSGDQRFSLKAGGRFGILRDHPEGEPDRGWQLSIEGGFDAQFDMDYSLDNIGWDGNYGLLLTTATGEGLAFKLAALHTSSHVGDEYAERTGRLRIGYTRHEVAAGVSWSINEHWRTYIEAARGYNLRNDILQEPNRAQAGLEYERPRSLWQGRMGWYAALDVQSWEERDWRVDIAVQTGVMFRTRSRTWRFGIEHYNGRPPMGEFFQDNETYTALGLWIDG